MIGSPLNIVWSTVSSNSDTPFSSSVPPPDGGAFISEQTFVNNLLGVQRAGSATLRSACSWDNRLKSGTEVRWHDLATSWSAWSQQPRLARGVVELQNAGAYPHRYPTGDDRIEMGLRHPPGVTQGLPCSRR